MMIKNPSLYEKMLSLDEEKREIFEEYRGNDLRNFRKTTLFSLIPLSLISFAGGYLIAGQMLSPLKELNKKIKNINIKNLKSKLSYEKTGDEISELIENFNEMIARLNLSFEAQKEFIENASHELKTPLAIIQTNLDSILLDNKITKKEISSLIESSRKSTKFMNKLIEDLLLLALLENQVKKRKLSLENVVTESTNNLRKIASENRIKLQLDITGKHFSMSGNFELLQRAIMNLIENAIKYSPKKSAVEVTLADNKDTLTVDIIDHGRGITEPEQKKIFERFYRTDKSRSRKTGGAGLGLAIAKKIVWLHKGKITVASKKGVGSRFKVEFPRNNI